MSDGTDRMKNGKRRFLGPLGGKGISYRGYQYVVYYSGKDRNLDESDAYGRVVVGRRKLGTKKWQKSVLAGYKIRSDDTHNRADIAISEADGVIHITFDHHNEEQINYAASSLGVADHPLDVQWDDTVFEYKKNLAMENLGPQRITYPSFSAFPGGNLIVYYRQGGASNGDMRIARYDALQHKWMDIRNVSTREGTFEGRKLTRGPYLAGGMQVAENGELHMAWVFRERPQNCAKGFKSDAFCNHGLYYAYSPDKGINWFSNEGRLIANTNLSESISIDNLGSKVINVPTYLGPSNVAFSSAIDHETGDFHVLLKHLTSKDENATYRMHHYIRRSNGSWRGEASNFKMSDVRLAFHRDTLFAFAGRRDAKIFYATRANGFSDWKQIELPSFSLAPNDVYGGYLTWDISQLNLGIASAIWQQAPKINESETATAIYVIDFRIGGYRR